MNKKNTTECCVIAYHLYDSDIFYILFNPQQLYSFDMGIKYVTLVMCMYERLL